MYPPNGVVSSNLEEEVLLAYLFGSRAAGTAGPRSDYDIALLVHNPSLDQQARLAHEIGAILEAEQVDVVFLNRAPVGPAYADYLRKW